MIRFVILVVVISLAITAGHYGYKRAKRNPNIKIPFAWWAVCFNVVIILYMLLARLLDYLGYWPD